MKYKLLKPWNMMSPGTEIDVDKPIADTLIQRGIINPSPPAVESPPLDSTPTPARSEKGAQGFRGRKNK